MNVKQAMQKPHRHRPFNWTLAGLLVTWAMIALTTVWAVASDWSSQADRVTAVTMQVEDHERRLRVVERQLTQIATDVKWIRNHLEAR